MVLLKRKIIIDYCMRQFNLFVLNTINNLGVVQTMIVNDILEFYREICVEVRGI